MLFANFAEAMAEGRGKAQADSLRKARKDIQAKQTRRGRDATPRPSPVLASQLRKGDLVLVEAGDVVPGDGEIVEGVASVDESAITGESAPVIRESGGDRSAVTGGTRVLSDWLIVRITANPGETFLDRMIAMVEGAKRQKTPNEIALDILLAALTIIFLLATVTLLPFSLFSVDAAGQGRAGHHHGARRAARLPDPDDHRRAALGHRHRRHGPHDPGERHRDDRPRGRGRGRRRRAAARQDGHDHARQPAGDGVPPGAGRRRSEALADAAQLSSLADETPEGRSIVVLAKEKYGIRERDVHALKATFVPFTAQTRMSGVDLDGREIRKGAADAIEAYVRRQGRRVPGRGASAASRRIAKQGGTPLVVAEGRDGARRHPAQGHREGRHQGALRRAAARWASRR